tara:strand:+ start:7446 stop:8111 length:666 start_codon:yes stop_codon:yes gene_type:complete
MKHLRQYIRGILLTEGMKTEADLPDGIGIIIRQRAWEDNPSNIVISYYNLNTEYPLETDRENIIPWGMVTLGLVYPYEPAYNGQDERFNLPEDTSNLTCGNAFQIFTTDAADGWGPLLYDVAIEWATMNGNGLISDRSGVSEDAQAVWEYYMYNRPDVQKFQCDDHLNTLTATLDDNVDMNIPMADGRSYFPEDLENDPLGKRYTKEPTRIRQLGDKLVIR